MIKSYFKNPAKNPRRRAIMKKGPLALFKGMLFSFAKVRGNLATNKQQNALR